MFGLFPDNVFLHWNCKGREMMIFIILLHIGKFIPQSVLPILMPPAISFQDWLLMQYFVLCGKKILLPYPKFEKMLISLSHNLLLRKLISLQRKWKREMRRQKSNKLMLILWQHLLKILHPREEIARKILSILNTSTTSLIQSFSLSFTISEGIKNWAVRTVT